MLRHSLIASVVASIAAPVVAQSVTSDHLVCDRGHVRAVLANESFETLCGCDAITNKSIRMIQRSKKFEAVLNTSAQQCSGLAELLYDSQVISTRSEPATEPSTDPDDPNFPPHDGPNPEPDTPEPETPEPETPEPEPEEPETAGVYNGW